MRCRPLRFRLNSGNKQPNGTCVLTPSTSFFVCRVPEKSWAARRVTMSSICLSFFLFSLLGLNGIHHYWKDVCFFSWGLNQMEDTFSCCSRLLSRHGEHRRVGDPGPQVRHGSAGACRFVGGRESGEFLSCEIEYRDACGLCQIRSWSSWT